jgi:hypothetical protein
LDAAFTANPARFRHRPPTAPKIGRVVDQPAPERGGCSELVKRMCLKSLDGFRFWEADGDTPHRSCPPEPHGNVHLVYPPGPVQDVPIPTGVAGKLPREKTAR